jgi:DnaJ family protein C protein 6
VAQQQDIVDPAERLPEYDGAIFAKILRLCTLICCFHCSSANRVLLFIKLFMLMFGFLGTAAINRRPLHTRLRRKLPEEFKQRPFNPPSFEPESTTTRASSGAGVGIKPSSTPQSAAASKASPAAKSASSPAVNAKPAQAKPKPAPAAAAAGASVAPAAKKPAKVASSPSVTASSPPAESFEAFLSGSGSSTRTPQPANVHTDDFLSFSEPAVVRQPPTSPDFFGASSNGGGSTESPGIDIDESIRIVANGAAANGGGIGGGSALELYQQVEEMNKKRSDEMEEARQKLGPRLTQWAEDNGKKRNVRTLLTTMHEVLWEGAKWTPVTLVDVIDPKKVKLIYRRAMLVVHPDRNGNLSGVEMFIAKRIFEAINEAYSEFLQHEQP